jgi:hypothetical protein
MLARHDAQSVIDAIRPVMTEAGFERRESTWYRFSLETVQIFDVQPAASRSPQRVYFNLGVTFRKLHPPTHFRVFDCPVYGRLDHIIPEGEQFSTVTDFAHPDSPHDERIARIVDFIRRFALPVLDSWQSRAGVTAFIESERSKGFTVKQSQTD